MDAADVAFLAAMSRASTPVLRAAQRKIVPCDAGVMRADVIDVRRAVAIRILQQRTAISGGRTSLIGTKINTVRLAIAVDVIRAGLRTAGLWGR